VDELRGADLTRDKLLRATHDVYVERRGEGASVSEICARAEVNVAMVKYCFGSKDGLLDALLEQVLSGLARELDRLGEAELEPDEKLRRNIAGIVRNYVRYPYVNRLMNARLLRAKPADVDRISRSFAVPARAFYARLLADGYARAGWRELDPTLFFFTLVGMCEFLFAGRDLLEGAFGQELDDVLVERFVEHVTALVAGGTGSAPRT